MRKEAQKQESEQLTLVAEHGWRRKGSQNGQND
jgi:hypothetical protein